MIKRKKPLFAGIIILALAIAGLQLIQNRQEQKQSSTYVKKGTLIEELVLSGEIDADEKVSLKFQTSGLLTYIGVKEGDYVKKNQTIATLDQRSIKKTLDKYLNTYLKTRQDFDQTKADNPDAAIYTDRIKRVVTKSQTDLNNSVLDVELQDIALQLSRLITPIEGIVTKVDAPYPGINIIASSTTFEVINPDTIYLEVSADQTEVTKIKEGMKAVVVLDAYPDEKEIASVSNISFTPREDESGTVYIIKLTFGQINNKQFKYRIGMTGDVTFVTQEKNNALYLPIQYIKEDEKGKYVLKGEKKEKTYVITGLETDTKIEIRSGLKEDVLVYD